MKILFLGTAACDYSKKIETDFVDVFDFDARRSSSVLLEDKYLIDCGDHTLDSLRIANIDITKISDIFITHLHRDHYNTKYIETIAKKKQEKLRVWVREEAIVPKLENVLFCKMKKGEKYVVEKNLCVMGLPANHEADVYPQHFLFKDMEKSFFYALDGGWLLNETYSALKDTKLDLLVLDCTCGDYVGDYRIGSHNSIPMIRLMLPSLRKWGAIVEGTHIYISHLAPSLHASHKETVALLEKDGICVAYDGLQLQF